MRLELMNFYTSPANIVAAGFDCLWVLFEKRSSPSPLTNRSLQWIDWKMQGELSRYLLNIRCENGGNTVFVHPLKKLPIPYIVFNGKEGFDPLVFRIRCEGLKLERVLLFCEDSTLAFSLQNTLDKASWGECPKVLILGYEKKENG